MRNKRKSALVSLLLIICFGTFSAADSTSKYKPVPVNQADSLGILLVQTFEGEFNLLIRLLMMYFIRFQNKIVSPLLMVMKWFQCKF